MKTSETGDQADDQADERITIGDWVAQWDTEYEDWFYYNILTRQSTWIKPRELGHVTFKRREETSDGKLISIVCSLNQNDNLGKIDEHYYSIPSNNFVLTSQKRQPTLTPAPIPKYHHVRNSPNLAPSLGYRGVGAKQRVFVESDNGEFFGLNTTIFRTDGILGGLYKKLANYYDDSAKVSICYF